MAIEGMAKTERLTGVVTPLLTPYENDLSITEGLYLEHAAHCLDGGAHYLSPFGTTGEAVSNTVQPPNYVPFFNRVSGTGGLMFRAW